MSKSENILPPHGGYRSLLTFQKAEIIYDGTVFFCRQHLPRFDRTIDQMVQAARSGKQNIAEASMASGTSKEMEIKLTNVARASLEELVLDYEDFMRTHNIPTWERTHPYSKRFDQLNRTSNANYQTFKKAIENQELQIVTNVLRSLINVTTYLLKKQIATLEKQFIKDGGFKEKMYKARINYKKP
ncbi:four helix bundle suffix domain-containing protein [Aequorivita viscosa]|uniref:Four helix bundle suffix domain-containing protein n=1 Tax=Aequorivita viscosa TaxID=797419 RepID=A0A1M6KE95_9FLAO|nr:four helix bundle suffix domain-containing protein [Aequorivita viscosa]SDX20838.1 four helix bundle suffix domain-containing protein [Aequorivita viscosa]SHJ57263.1 four helix bundle suffix domain-containing protein [Aequorivita viscosa]